MHVDTSHRQLLVASHIGVSLMASYDTSHFSPFSPAAAPVCAAAAVTAAAVTVGYGIPVHTYAAAAVLLLHTTSGSP
jgi:hypothetical protein